MKDSTRQLILGFRNRYTQRLPIALEPLVIDCVPFVLCIKIHRLALAETYRHFKAIDGFEFTRHIKHWGGMTFGNT